MVLCLMVPSAVLLRRAERKVRTLHLAPVSQSRLQGRHLYLAISHLPPLLSRNGVDNASAPADLVYHVM
jgi:hypothetical protein